MDNLLIPEQICLCLIGNPSPARKGRGNGTAGVLSSAPQPLEGEGGGEGCKRETTSTVSFVVNDKADKYRIGHETQARILAAVRQLGYSPQRGISDERSQIKNEENAKGSIGLALSAVSPPESITMILATECHGDRKYD